jgi:hypothetical protein
MSEFTASAKSVNGTLRREIERKLETAVHLPEGLTDAQIRAVRRVVETCPVRRALSAGFTFHDRL